MPVHLTRPRILAVLLVSTVLTGFADQLPNSWPPGVVSVPDESPVLSPEDAMRTFYMPPGFRLELVASEPLIEEPVVIDWDSQGRLWVVEMPSYMRDLPATAEREPTGRVSILEDRDGDGRMDRKTVFLDGLVLPRALKVLERGALVAEPPNVWLARDTDGDLRADAKELVTDRYGQELANVEHNANSLLWAMDNWIHTSESDTMLRLKNGRFEVRRTLPRGQWGASQDDAGRIYRNTNESALFVDIVPTPYFTRNPNLLRTRGSYETLNAGDLNLTWPARPTAAVNRGYQSGVLRPDLTLRQFTAVCAPTVFRGDRLPSELYGNVFVAEPAGNLVSRVIVEDDGTTLRGRKAYEGAEFLASTDERFRPVWLSSAPDGTLYIVDMYHGIIQHRDYITEYLRDQILARKLDRPSGYGRIYRVVHETTKPERTPQLSRASSGELVDALAHPNGWWRDAAQRILVEREDRSVVPLLKTRAERAPDWRTRLHAMWTLDALDSLELPTVLLALEDPLRDVRVSGLRLSERWLRQADERAQAAVLKLLGETDWAVRRQLAATLGELPETAPARVSSLATLLERHATDPITADAALSSLHGLEGAVLRRLLGSTDQTPQRSAAVTLLAATMIRGGDESIQALFRIADEADLDGWQVDALMAGGEAALLNEPLPGSLPRASRPAVPNTAPGGRDGPGGARAFPSETASSRSGRGGTAPVVLSREPAPLLDLAGGGGQLAERAQALLNRFTWPGKHVEGEAVRAAAPLSPEEQQRFEAGRTTYTNLCVACHQEDGAGREKLAPGLVGSPFTVGPAGVPIRILVNGKEGPTGLMPPLGAVLTDEQVAGVLTYIRRAWGNAASPISPADVEAIRRDTTDRGKPWTDAELSKLLDQGK